MRVRCGEKLGEEGTTTHEQVGETILQCISSRPMDDCNDRNEGRKVIFSPVNRRQESGRTSILPTLNNQLSTLGKPLCKKVLGMWLTGWVFDHESSKRYPRGWDTPSKKA